MIDSVLKKLLYNYTALKFTSIDICWYIWLTAL